MAHSTISLRETAQGGLTAEPRAEIPSEVEGSELFVVLIRQCLLAFESGRNFPPRNPQAAT